jgi:hypothetical protein
MTPGNNNSNNIPTTFYVNPNPSTNVLATQRQQPPQPVVVSRRHTGAPSILVPTVPCTAVTQEPAQSVQHIPSTSTLLVAVVPSVIPCQAKGVVEQGARSELLPTSTVIREHARSETRPRFSAWRKGGRTADLIGQESGQDTGLSLDPDAFSRDIRFQVPTFLSNQVGGAPTFPPGGEAWSGFGDPLDLAAAVSDQTARRV